VYLIFNEIIYSILTHLQYITFLATCFGFLQNHMLTYVYYRSTLGGRDSSVGIATCYGLDGPGIEYLWG
jgi:hypothetical protein